MSQRVWNFRETIARVWENRIVWELVKKCIVSITWDLPGTMTHRWENHSVWGLRKKRNLSNDVGKADLRRRLGTLNDCVYVLCIEFSLVNELANTLPLIGLVVRCPPIMINFRAIVRAIDIQDFRH